MNDRRSYYIVSRKGIYMIVDSIINASYYYIRTRMKLSIIVYCASLMTRCCGSPSCLRLTYVPQTLYIWLYLLSPPTHCLH